MEPGVPKSRPAPPREALAKLRAIAFGLPEAVEEAAWAGTRWCVRKKNFAHLLAIDDGWPPAYVRAAGTRGPACVLTFRLPSAQAEGTRFATPPFFKPVWWPDIAGMRIDDRTDWDEVERLVVGSYCRLAPKRLVALVDSRAS